MKHRVYNIPYMLSSETFVEIDVGIFDVIYSLWKENIHTFQSCQGGVIDIEHISSDSMINEKRIISSKPWVICQKSGEDFLKKNFLVETVIDGEYGFFIDDYIIPENKEISKHIITCIFKEKYEI